MILYRGSLMLFFISLLALPVQAQLNEDIGIVTENGYRRYITIGVGATYQSFIDDAISTYNYQKIGFTPSVGHIKQNNTTYAEILFHGSILKFNRNKDKLIPLSVHAKRVAMDYRFLVRLPIDYENRHDLRVGPILNAMYSHRKAPHLLDAQNIREYAITFGLSGRYQRELQYYKKTIFFTWDVSMPFIAHYTRPAHLNREENLDPDNKSLGDFVSTGITESITKYLRLNSRLAFTIPSGNGNQYRISYQWDYFNIKHNTQLYFAEHTVMFTFFFNY